MSKMRRWVLVYLCPRKGALDRLGMTALLSVSYCAIQFDSSYDRIRLFERLPTVVCFQGVTVCRNNDPLGLFNARKSSRST